MAKRKKHETLKTLCGAEYQDSEGLFICTLNKDHAGDHIQEGEVPFSWMRGEVRQSDAIVAPPAVEKKDSEPVQKPRTVEFADGLTAKEGKDSVFIDVSPDKILVDKLLFSKAFKAISQGAQGGRAYAGRSGITKFGNMAGATNQKECDEFYRSCMAVVAEDNKRLKG